MLKAPRGSVMSRVFDVEIPCLLDSHYEAHAFLSYLVMIDQYEVLHSSMTTTSYIVLPDIDIF